jgi:hypothetical protein
VYLQRTSKRPLRTAAYGDLHRRARAVRSVIWSMVVRIPGAWLE